MIKTKCIGRRNHRLARQSGSVVKAGQPAGMDFAPFQPDDVNGFLQLAVEENWVVEPWEFDYLLTAFRQGCFVARTAEGNVSGYVTSIQHDRSGWIGNLIVSGNYRGLGIGEALFLKALHALRSSGVETVWLTASKMGKALYEKHGFRSVDTIFRWSGEGRRKSLHQYRETRLNHVEAYFDAIDRQAWGDHRSGLLAATGGRGAVLGHDKGFVVLQPCGDAVQLGPFAALDDHAAGHLLNNAMRNIPVAQKVYVDVPAGNRAAQRLFNRRRMRITGANELMYCGVRPEYRPELVFGLATMGSCG